MSGSDIYYFLQGGNDKTCPIIWKSHKLKRVAKSPMAAETMALLEAAEHAQLLKVIILEVFGLKALPIVCVVDNKNLVDAANSSTTLEDNRVYIDVCAIREMIEKGEIDTVQHTVSSNQLADCLTKGTASSEKLVRVLEGRELIDV